MNYSKFDQFAPWNVPVGDPDPGKSWLESSRELAKWVMNSGMVIRVGAYGRYLSTTEMAARKDGARQKTEYGRLTIAVLERHFRGCDRSDIVGPLAYMCEVEKDEGDGGEWAWCQMVAWDIDNHDTSADQALPIANHRFAQVLYRRAKFFGSRWGNPCAHPAHPYTPMLIDSNGAGGFHIRMLFYHPVLAVYALAFGNWLASDYAKFGVQRPEVFPKQGLPTGKRIGSWLRLPGKHHTRNHWSRVWDGATWLDGVGAVGYLHEAGNFMSDFDLPRGAERFIARRTSNWSNPVSAPILEADGWAKPTYVASDAEFDLALLRDALAHYSCEELSNPDIFKVGAALKHLGDTGVDLWVDWLCKPANPYWQRSENNYNDDYWSRAWGRFTGECGLGTIFFLAEEAGWDRKARARVVGRKLRARRNLAKVEAKVK